MNSAEKAALRVHANVSIDKILAEYAGSISYEYPGHFELVHKGRAYLIGTINDVWQFQSYDFKADPDGGNVSPNSIQCLTLDATTEDLIEFINTYILK